MEHIGGIQGTDITTRITPAFLLQVHEPLCLIHMHLFIILSVANFSSLLSAHRATENPTHFILNTAPYFFHTYFMAFNFAENFCTLTGVKNKSLKAAHLPADREAQCRRSRSGISHNSRRFHKQIKKLSDEESIKSE